MAHRAPDDVVRDYLHFLADPASVEPDTAGLDTRIGAETDPLERVKLRSERARAQDVGPRLEAEFIANVARWAEEHDIDPEALLEEGVERRVLVEAGMLSGTPRRAVRSGPSSRATSRAPRVSREAIADHVRGLRKGTSFTTATLSNDAGGSVGTIRKVIDALVEEGVVVEEGKDHSGPGRPRTRYQRL